MVRYDWFDPCNKTDCCYWNECGGKESPKYFSCKHSFHNNKGVFTKIGDWLLKHFLEEECVNRYEEN